MNRAQKIKALKDLQQGNLSVKDLAEIVNTNTISDSDNTVQFKVLAPGEPVPKIAQGPMKQTGFVLFRKHVSETTQQQTEKP